MKEYKGYLIPENSDEVTSDMLKPQIELKDNNGNPAIILPVTIEEMSTGKFDFDRLYAEAKEGIDSYEEYLANQE